MTSRLINGRWRRTRQMVLKVRSMVSIVITAETARITMPHAVSRPALSANCCMYTDMTLPAEVGIRLVTTNCRIVPEKPENPGKAENTVTVMVISGTSASIVVNVRLPATWKQRSSCTRSCNSTRYSNMARTGCRMGATSRLGAASSRRIGARKRETGLTVMTAAP